MEGESWDLGDIFNTFDSQSVCMTDKPWDLLVKFSDVNIISHNPCKRNIYGRLKMIRKDRHKEYLSGRKSLSFENSKNNENSKNAIIFKTEM